MNQAPNKKPRRRWLAFTMRGMLLGITLLCVFLGLIGVKWIESRRQEAAVDRLREGGAWVLYDYWEEFHQQERELLIWEFRDDPDPYGPAIVRSVFGEHILSRVVEVDMRGGPSRGDPVNQLAKDLPNFSRLHSLSFAYNVPLTNETIEYVTQIPRLNSLFLRGGCVTPTQLRKLSECNSLTSLTLEDTDASDEHLQQLRYFPQLKSVQIRNDKPTNIDLTPLAEVATLEELEWDLLCHVTPDALATLGNLKHLKRLAFYLDDQVTERCLPSLCRITSLEELHLHIFNNSRVDFHVDDYAELGNLRNLQVLEIGWTNIQDDAMPFVAQLRNLRSLDLHATDLSERGLAHIAQLSKLESLDIYGTEATNETLAQLTRLEHLKTLNIDGTKTTEKGIVHLLNMPALQTLIFDFPISKANLQKLVDKTSIHQIEWYVSGDRSVRQNLLAMGFVEGDNSNVFIRGSLLPRSARSVPNNPPASNPSPPAYDSDDPFGDPSQPAVPLNSDDPFVKPASSDPFE